MFKNTVEEYQALARHQAEEIIRLNTTIEKLSKVYAVASIITNDYIPRVAIVKMLRQAISEAGYQNDRAKD